MTNNDFAQDGILLFVFGTLKKGWRNDHYLRHAKLIGPAISIDNDYQMQDVGFPTLWQGFDIADCPSGCAKNKLPYPNGCEAMLDAACSRKQNCGQVMGEIYKIDQGQLANCDRLEGNGRMYTRAERQFKVAKRGGRVVVAWVYLWNLDRDHEPVEPVDGVLIWDREGKRKRT
jgi:gamma-glutamylcyclotransferase (GGCT)/AIG2-like uncharacterized protein YtfP